jgi:RHS repeat-associated protein
LNACEIIRAADGRLLGFAVVEGSNVEEFRNDAFGNMTRKMNRRSAGLINTAPFTLAYSVTGALTSWNTSLTTPPQSQYDRNDNLNQDFSAGRLLRQDEIIQDPNTGTVSLELAARHYYGADDRLMAVQRYSWRSAGVLDGTWEEYWYDALGRRVMTRARRNGGSPYDTTTNSPLCQNASVPTCRSFTERVWWDGDQSLVEKRTAEGTSDVSNSGLLGNIHALTLDEPLAVVTTSPSETRIINYNWRGQGMSSVYANGQGADNATGGSAEIDWPALTQAQTYFTPSLDATAPDNNPKKWMGTFVQNGQGTTGMLYRRNRYFDANTGRFTQEDPIGIAGGVNAYGFANGDPVNLSDPFGLCPPIDDNYNDCSPGSSEWYAGRIARGEGNRGVNEVGGVLASCGESISCMTTLIPGTVIGAAAGRVAQALGLAEKAVGSVSIALGSELETQVAGKLWAGEGATAIRASRGAGDVVGTKSANGLRIFRQAQVKPLGHFSAGENVANLVNKATGGNTHLIIKNFMWW